MDGVQLEIHRDKTYDESIEEQISRKEQLQEKHYVFQSELQNMAQELPQIYQQRLPYELLSNLANSLLDGTVFEIVRGLKEIQHMREKNLFERRIKIVNANKGSKLELLKKHKELLAMEKHVRPHNVPVLQAKQELEKNELESLQETEMTRTDMKLIMELDQQVSDQQVTLEKAGVPGFFVTNNPHEIQLQMYLLEFIVSLYNTHCIPR